MELAADRRGPAATLRLPRRMEILLEQANFMPSPRLVDLCNAGALPAHASGDVR